MHMARFAVASYPGPSHPRILSLAILCNCKRENAGVRKPGYEDRYTAGRH